jgi:hypothetical protein
MDSPHVTASNWMETAERLHSELRQLVWLSAINNVLTFWLLLKVYGACP